MGGGKNEEKGGVTKVGGKGGDIFCEHLHALGVKKRGRGG